VVRSVPWPQVVAVLTLAVTPTVVTAARGADRFDGAVLAWLLIAAAVGCLAYDEPTREVSDASPTTLARRVVSRLVVVLTAAAVSGAAVALLATFDVSATEDARAQLPAAAAVLALSSASAALSRRRGAARVSLGDVAVGPLTVLTVSALSQQYAWLPSVADDRSVGRWWYVAALAGAVAVWSTRDPARRW
jgi:hypothetical protein